jgi:hypothetical protein
VGVAPIPPAQTIPVEVDPLAINRVVRVQPMAVEVDGQDADASGTEETDNKLISKDLKAKSLR